MIHGYARVSTVAQYLASQFGRLKAAGCAKVFREKIAGTTVDRPQLRKLMADAAPAEGSARARGRWRAATQRRPQLQRQPGDDFTAHGMTRTLQPSRRRSTRLP
jgi:hypothetical protein